MSLQTTPYGLWQSPLDLTLLFEKPSPPMYPQYYQGCYYWIEARAKEGGRLVLIRLNPDGTESCLTPETYNIRTRVHEYGGRCFVLGNGCVYFSNYHDQRLYRQTLNEGSDPTPLTADTNKATAFADLHLSPSGRFIIAVMEKFHSPGYSDNSLVTVNVVDAGRMEAEIIIAGDDFYANPVVDRNQNRLAWIQWSHPNMPWDQATLFITDIKEGEDKLAVGGAQKVAGGKDTSVCQLGFYDGDLVFAMDTDRNVESCDDYWNLYRYREGVVTRLTCDSKEYGAPHWTFGDTNHAELDNGKLAAKRVGDEGDELVVIDRESREQNAVQIDFDSLTFFSGYETKEKNETLMVAASATKMPQVVSFGGDVCKTIKSVDQQITTNEISIGTPIQYPTRDGGTAHGYYYIPHNTGFRGPDDQLPPLLVMVHGGPTSRTTRALDLSRQYWTGLGFAVFDVNHRGSTGHGRRYRQRLLGAWGRVDIDDIVDGIDFLVNQSLVDPDKIFIRGKSAGGYTVLGALTQYPHYFCAGACYYGIGNLSTLAATTHKFESYYTDRLIGESYDEATAKSKNSEYYKRSPVYFMHRVTSPMILFQGLDDPIVPPDLSREVVEVLANHNIDHEYVEYRGEGHGFRKSETNIDALQKETRFYQRILATRRHK